MCKERWRTRDLLLEYDMLPRPRAAGLSIVYPWENSNTSILLKQLYEIATKTGFIGTEIDFKAHFGAYLQNKQIIFDTFENFPEIGSDEYLYFDLLEKILYYWDNEYKPINTLLIEGTILNAGTSTISIE